MKEDVGTSKPPKYASKVGMVLVQEANIGPKFHITLH